MIFVVDFTKSLSQCVHWRSGIRGSEVNNAISVSVSVIVLLYNNVKGVVPRSELSMEPIQALDKEFYIGQVSFNIYVYVVSSWICLYALVEYTWS